MNKPLKKAIKDRGLAKTDVAILAKISDQHLRKLLKGEADNPRVKTIKELSRVLQVPVTELGFF